VPLFASLNKKPGDLSRQAPTVAASVPLAVLLNFAYPSCKQSTPFLACGFLLRYAAGRAGVFPADDLRNVLFIGPIVCHSMGDRAENVVTGCLFALKCLTAPMTIYFVNKIILAHSVTLIFSSIPIAGSLPCFCVTQKIFNQVCFFRHLRFFRFSGLLQTSRFSLRLSRPLWFLWST
jgi:hypothetical protein